MAIAFTIGMIFAGVIVIFLAWPMAVGRVRPNPWYGYRTRGSLASEELWYRTNRVAGRWGLIAGAIVIATAMTVNLLELEPGIGALLTTGVLMVGVLAAGGRARLEEKSGVPDGHR